MKPSPTFTDPASIRIFLFDTFREVLDKLDKINAESKAEST
jgi:hypothetical protein